MFRERHRQRRKPSAPPKESILTNILGEYLDPIDALFTIFFSILFALLFTLSYGILIKHGVISSSFASGYGQSYSLPSWVQLQPGGSSTACCMFWRQFCAE